MAGKNSKKAAVVAKKIAADKPAAKVAATKPAAAKKVAKKASATKAATKKAASQRGASKETTKAKVAAKSASGKAAKPTLLAGDNPQIAKGYGDAPVKAYVAAIPGWKQDVARRLDVLVTRTVPAVYKAVKWNTPLYGIEGDGWFLAMHCFKNYVKVTFFRGQSLTPVPPVASKTAQTRYFHIHESDTFDEAQLAAWIRQASALPGERM